LTMLFDERDIKLGLFDQTWRHQADASPIDNSNRGSSRPRSPRPSHSTSSSPFVSTPGAAPASRTSGPTTGGIPGFGPNDGLAPGLQLPGSSGLGSNPGSPAVSGLPEVPGLGGGAAGGERTGGGSVGGIPGLPGSGLPGLPGAPQS
jgi:hypothetical protein